MTRAAPRKRAPRPGEEKRPVGRPSEYRRELCDDLVAFCRDGYSITAFAGEIGVCRETLSEWGRVHPEFSVSLKRAKAAAARWWEERGRKVGERGGGPGTATMITFQLRNMAADDFAEKSEVKHSGDPENPVVQRIERVVIDPPNPDG